MPESVSIERSSTSPSVSVVRRCRREALSHAHAKADVRARRASSIDLPVEEADAVWASEAAVKHWAPSRDLDRCRGCADSDGKPHYHLHRRMDNRIIGSREAEQRREQRRHQHVLVLHYFEF